MVVNLARLPHVLVGGIAGTGHRPGASGSAAAGALGPVHGIGKGCSR